MINADITKNTRNLLKHSWTPFFSKFGKLTSIQQETIPKILNGSNVIIVSPTATGKTEAVVAPVAEKVIKTRSEGLSVVYIVPTRALANDSLQRIEGPLSDMGISIALKHGDKPYLPKKLPNFIITTPESLDSLICRRPKAFTNLHTIILDEIHLLDSTYRGDQLRILIKRLRSLVHGGMFSTHLLSATLSNPNEIAERYVSSFEIVSVPGRREVNHYVFRTLGQIYEFARSNMHKKILVFCNMRKTVEQCGNDLAKLWNSYQVVVHHGSLSRRVREDAELLMKEADVAVCVSTSTLEVGIDIGNIDLVVLAEIPFSVSSLVQRMGRGNRRRNCIEVVALVASDDEEKMLESMLKLSESGYLQQNDYRPDLSVVIQQIFSFFYQYPGGKQENEIIDVVSPLCSPKTTKIILSHLLVQRWLTLNGGYWQASEKVMNMGDRGLIHSNIPDEGKFRVFDIDSAKEIGTISGGFDSVFVLARKTWKILSIKGDIVNVKRFIGKALPVSFRRSREIGAFHHLLPIELQRVNLKLIGVDQTSPLK